MTPETSLPERIFALLERCGSDLHCRSAHSERWRACLYCRNAVLHCRSAMAPETLLSERIFALLKRVLIMPERCGLDLHCRSVHSECQSTCLYCQSTCENRRENAV
ncbi:hypothetical protein AMTR_s00002p00090270 [Amborella trichopoda]|uniref:Uncharacterized protein n=1 Tax=Amborella trichopoda TaxID=13333 RepID=W1P007_AMBTC|nr:hypothetical protein AMTR_s00002p00090270 [Amborella trichopoda]